MGEPKFTSSAAISLHIERDINRRPEVRCWSGDVKNSPFLTERVSGDFRAHDLVPQKIRHFEIEFLRPLVNTSAGPVSAFRPRNLALVRNKAAVLLDFKPDRTFGRIDTGGLRETLSKH